MFPEDEEGPPTQRFPRAKKLGKVINERVGMKKRAKKVWTAEERKAFAEKMKKYRKKGKKKVRVKKTRVAKVHVKTRRKVAKKAHVAKVHVKKTRR